MGDSDDEYDRKRRDKFRGERSSGDNYRSDRRNDDRGRGRDDWPDRGRSGRPDYRDYRRDRFSPDRGGPQVKRMRNDWGDDGRPRYVHDGYLPYGGGGGGGVGGVWGAHDHYPLHGVHGSYGGHPPVPAAHTRGAPESAQNNQDLPTQPAMLTLKQFLTTQDDSISDSDAIAKYNEYKLEFKRQQLNEFFITHKDEEWFKIKYHPEEATKRKDEQLNFLKNRAQIFENLLNSNHITIVSVDTIQTDSLLRLLDTAVIKLEGGTEDDLKILDEKPIEIKPIELKPVEQKMTTVATAQVTTASNVTDEWGDIQGKKPIVHKSSIIEEDNWDDDGLIPGELTTVPVTKTGRNNPFAVQKKSSSNTNNDWGDCEPKKPIVNVLEGDEENWDDDVSAELVADSPIESNNKNNINDEWGDATESNRKITDNDEYWDGDSSSNQKPVTPKEILIDSDNEENSSTTTTAVTETMAATTTNKTLPNDLNKDSSAKSPVTNLKRSQSESSSSSSSSSDSENDEKKNDTEEQQPVSSCTEQHTETNTTIQNDQLEDAKMKTDAGKSNDDVPTVVVDDSDDLTKKENVKLDGSKMDEEEEEDKVETIDLDKEIDSKDDEPGPKALHKTSSIFLRNLAPTITKGEVEAMCKRYNGFLRVAIADPLVERRWFRRGWVTFQRDVNIKEICWNLNNIRLRDCELGAIVNRDLSRRIRPVNGITAHRNIVRSDIKLCAKIAYNLDLKAKLWQTENEPSTNGKSLTCASGASSIISFGLNSSNPVLQNITDYLIEEASAEEDELLGLATGDNKDADGEMIERDVELITVLDKLILYLRIVHSVDFYNHCEYPYEDEMPNRLGIIHARGPIPQNKVSNTEIQDYIRNFEGKMSSFLAKNQPIEVNELKKLGSKDTEAEVEKFIQANTQELAKDKWLCPLSGKKFKGPDFIRKHIYNKHIEKVDEVKKEVEYFNNYLKDSKRPQLPEHPGNNRKPAPEMHQQQGYRPAYMAPMYAAPYAYAPPMIVPPRPRGGFGNRRGVGAGGGSDYRPIIHYRDLDAPREPEDFL